MIKQITRLHIYSFSFHLMLVLILFTPYISLYVVNGEDFWSGVLSIVSFSLLVFKYTDKNIKVKIALSDVVFTLCAIFFIINLHQPINLNVLTDILTMIGLWIFFRQDEMAKYYHKMSWYIIIFTTLQALATLLQYIGFLPSYSIFFPVTGTFGNPAPLGGYLSIGFITLLGNFFYNSNISKWHKWGYLVCGFLLFYSLVLADSRAAWLGIGISLCILLYYKNKSRRKPLKIIVLITSMILVLFMLHQYRPESSNARLRIWKVCTSMIKKSPFIGNGTGSFASSYMFEQTDIISEASDEIRRTTDNVNVAYNEIIMVLCEQGIIGLLLVILFLSIVIRNLWYNFKTNNQNSLIFPVVSILTFAQFSYPSSILSISAIFIAIVSAGQNCSTAILTITKHKMKISALLVFLLLVSIVDFKLKIYAYNRLEKYLMLESQQLSVSDNSIIGWYIRHEPNLLASNAEAQMMVGDNGMAISSILHILQYRVNTHWYICLGNLYEEREDFDMAEHYYIKAHDMQPGLLEPLFARFQLWQNRDKEIALQLALKVRDTSPKIENRKTDAMKSEVIRFINNIND